MPINQLKTGALISYLALFVNVLIGLLYTPWLIRSIGQSDYGLYTLAMSIIGLVSFDFGLGHATTKFVSQYLAEGRLDKVNNLMGMIFKLYILLDILLFLLFFILYFLLPTVYTGLTVSELSRFKTVYLLATSYCIISFPFIPLNGVLTSYEQFIQLKSCDLFCRVFIVICMSICLLLGYGLFAVVIVNSLSGLITIGLKLFVVRKNTSLVVNYRFWDVEHLKEIGSFILWTTIVALSARVIFNLAPSVLGVFSNSSAIATMGVVITLEGFVYMFANAINGMFLPRVSRLLEQNDSERIQDLMAKVGRIQLFIIGFIYVFLLSLGKLFINVWMGTDYGQVYPCILIVVFPSLFHLPQEIGQTCIIAANKVKYQSYVYIIMGIVNVALSIPFTIMWGVWGMCFSICVAFLVRVLGLNYIYHKYLNIDLWRFYKQVYLQLIPFFLVIIIISILINMLIPLEGWGGLFAKSFLIAIAFSFLGWLIAMNEYEKGLIREPLDRLFHLLGLRWKGNSK